MKPVTALLAESFALIAGVKPGVNRTHFIDL